MSYTVTRRQLEKQLRRANKAGLPAWASAHADTILIGTKFRFDKIQAAWKAKQIDRATYNTNYARTVNEMLYTSHVLYSFLASLPRPGVKTL